MAEPTVREIMDPEAPAVAPEIGVEDLVRRFAELEVGLLPVVNGSGRCVGVVTENDLVIADEEGDLHIPHYIELFGGLIFLEPFRAFEARLRKAAAATAEDLMSKDPVTVEGTATLHEAAHTIVSHGHSRLPVVEHGIYQGLVTRADVLRALNDGA